MFKAVTIHLEYEISSEKVVLGAKAACRKKGCKPEITFELSFQPIFFLNFRIDLSFFLTDVNRGSFYAKVFLFYLPEKSIVILFKQPSLTHQNVGSDLIFGKREQL